MKSGSVFLLIVNMDQIDCGVFVAQSAVYFFKWYDILYRGV